MATKTIGGGISFAGNAGIRGRIPKVSVSGASADFEDSGLYHPPDVTIPAASVATLRATPYDLVAAPGAGKIIQLLSGILMLDYTAPAFTESSDNLEIRYTDASGAIVALIEMTAFITLTADAFLQVVPLKDVIIPANAKIVLFNNGDGELGNSGGSSLIWKAVYAVH